MKTVVVKFDHHYLCVLDASHGFSGEAIKQWHNISPYLCLLLCFFFSLSHSLHVCTVIHSDGSLSHASQHLCVCIALYTNHQHKQREDLATQTFSGFVISVRSVEVYAVYNQNCFRCDVDMLWEVQSKSQSYTQHTHIHKHIHSHQDDKQKAMILRYLFRHLYWFLMALWLDRYITFCF